jgi:hypothetical protein
MDHTIIAALIGGGCTVLSPIAAHFVRNALDARNYANVPKHRLKAIKGTWIGTVRERNMTHRITSEYPAHFDLFSRGRKIKGSGRTIHPNENIDLLLKGVFLDDKYIEVTYRNAKKAVRHYGVILLELSDDASELKGEVVFCGYDQPISRADLVFRRQ